MKRYRRLTGCLSRADADRLWHDLVAYRRATRAPWGNITRRPYGRGFALYEVEDEKSPGGKPNRGDS